MNTSITKEQFLTFRTAFKQLARDKKITSADLIVYNLMRGLHAKRGFGPITNANKLANGRVPYDTFKQTSHHLLWQMKRKDEKLATWNPFRFRELLTDCFPQLIVQLEADIKTEQ